MRNINQFLPPGLLQNSGHHAAKHPHFSSANNERTINPTNNVDADYVGSQKNAVGISVVYRAFASQFSSISSFGQPEVQPEPEEESSNFFDFDKVAENVLAFVGSSIQAAKSRGAEDSELETMFEQARNGVNQGIGEAKEQLADMNLLDEELEEGIEQSRSLIHQGIDKLHQNIFEQEQDNDIQPIATSGATVAQLYSSDVYHGLSQSSDLTIETADGDLVTISFSHLKEQMQSEQGSYAAGNGFEQTSFSRSSSSYEELNFSFSISGELDEGEQEAINALISDINKLQKEFFTGDINKAFEQALQLGFDESELSGFSLNLEKTSTSVVSQAYQEIATLGDEHANELAKYTKPLMDFAQQFGKVREQSEQLLPPDFNYLQQLMDKVFEAEFNMLDDFEESMNTFNKFIEKLV